jgi:hypothetical protein
MSALPFLSMPGEQETPSETILKSTSGESIALRSVRVTGRLDNLLQSTFIRRNYRNETGKNNM